ncbi:dihydrolipoyl dehydrogenase [Candidatus Woesearchaeota archaeon]|nr:dihydrolipoyl dehydrogenase [Candidatus Woesearchaeota archaeon]
MKAYDVIVIGSGSGLIIADEASRAGLKVALVDKGPLGGTCLNNGCIPSKMLVYPADRVMDINDSGKLGIKAKVQSVDFPAIMKRMHKLVNSDRRSILEGLKKIDYYPVSAKFVDKYALDIGISGKKIFIAAGSRPFIPPGLDNYLTNVSLLKLKKLPKSFIIIGGGYIAAEYSHFFSAMGTKVIILEASDRIIHSEEPDISKFLMNKLSGRVSIFTNTKVVSRTKSGVIAKTKGKQRSFRAEQVLVATGRMSNADLLDVKKAGIKTDKRGFIKVNDYLETNVKNIWAFGDIIGRQMFRHAANEAAYIAWNNSNGRKVRMDFDAVPRAVYSYPQIASIGMNEAEARKKHSVLIGKSSYRDVAKGEAMLADGFAKVIVDKKTMKLLGFHIIGPYAPMLIQEVADAFANGRKLDTLSAMHIHPSLSELIPSALRSLE